MRPPHEELAAPASPGDRGRVRQDRRAEVGRGCSNALVIGIALSLPAGGYALLGSLRAATARRVARAAAVGVPARRTPSAPTPTRSALKLQGRRAPARGALRAARAGAQGTAGDRRHGRKSSRRSAAIPARCLRAAPARSTDAAALEALARELRELPGVAHVPGRLGLGAAPGARSPAPRASRSRCSRRCSPSAWWRSPSTPSGCRSSRSAARSRSPS